MKFDVEKFLFLYANEYGAFKDKRKSDGLADLLQFIEEDEAVSDIRWAAYMLATVKHECAGTWQPIAEYGKGVGRKYGIPDPRTGKTYYGRGFVQLTWYDNYATMGRIFGIDLLHEPDLAMRPEVAYQIMSHGMRKGSFTGKRLGMYIDGDKCDYIGSRRIINALDCAEAIAGYATTLERLLRESEVT